MNFHHDTAACVIVGGHIIAAEEERWTGVNHNRTRRQDYLSAPDQALPHCLEATGITRSGGGHGVSGFHGPKSDNGYETMIDLLRLRGRCRCGPGPVAFGARDRQAPIGAGRGDGENLPDGARRSPAENYW